MAKAVLLLSGGLDSTLAGKILLEMGVEVEALHFSSPFCRCTPSGGGCSAAAKSAGELGIPVRHEFCGEDYLETVKHPRFGRGSGANACIDCRVFMFSHARGVMERTGADFIATGEVLGERPMSQNRRAMDLIERESGLDGLILRPLSATVLSPSLPEERGQVDRTLLKGITGRRRLPQLELAKEFGMTDFLCPAGGCLLNDPEFSVRFLELLAHDPGFGIRDANLLKIGRHLRLPSGVKAIIGRDEGENASLDRLASAGDTIVEPLDAPGPSALVLKSSDYADILGSMAAAAAWMKPNTQSTFEASSIGPGREKKSLFTVGPVEPAEQADLARWWIGLELTRALVGVRC